MTKQDIFTWLVVLPIMLLGCADRGIANGDGDGATEGPVPGELFGSCQDVEDCFDEWCVHPTDEPGFCTYPCSQGCAVSFSGTATDSCLSVADESVCALDCGGGKTCPPGMRCEQIDADGEPRSICF